MAYALWLGCYDPACGKSTVLQIGAFLIGTEDGCTPTHEDVQAKMMGGSFYFVLLVRCNIRLTPGKLF